MPSAAPCGRASCCCSPTSAACSIVDKRFIPTLTSDAARRLIATGAVTGGMIPKLDTCLDAVDRGVDAAVILDGRVPHAILLELFTEHGFGTQIVAGSH